MVFRDTATLVQGEIEAGANPEHWNSPLEMCQKEYWQDVPEQYKCVHIQYFRLFGPLILMVGLSHLPSASASGGLGAVFWGPLMSGGWFQESPLSFLLIARRWISVVLKLDVTARHRSRDCCVSLLVRLSIDRTAETNWTASHTFATEVSCTNSADALHLTACLVTINTMNLTHSTAIERPRTAEQQNLWR